MDSTPIIPGRSTDQSARGGSVPTMVAPGDQSVMASTTPVLSWNPVSDPEGDPVSYTVRVATGADGESGTIVYDSGLRGNIASGVYFGFSAAEVSRLRSLVGAGALSGRGLDWHTDSCSTPGGKGINGAFLGLFGNACGKHDFGYRNHEGIFGGTSEADRKRIDNQFRRDMQDVCTQFGIVITGRTVPCYGAAETMYRAVRTFGSSAYG